MNQEYKRKIVTQDNLIFHIRSLIVEGGSSKIYLAEQEIGDETATVLLKEYPSLETDPEIAFVRQNEKNQCEKIRESGFLGALPIQYFRDIKDSDIRVGIISDVRRGITLGEYVNSDEWKTLSDYERICLCSDIYHVVKNFHRETGLLHGDLSPSNIYLYETGQENDSSRTGKYAVALLDFGCSLPISEDGCQALARGTKGFSHPDIYNSGYDSILTLDKEWYSLKACLWFAVTGEAPANFGMNGRILKNNYPNRSVYGRIFDAESDVEGKAIGEEIERVRNYLNLPKPDLDRLYESVRRDFLKHMESRFSDLNVIQRILPDTCFETERGLNRYEDVADGKQVNFWRTYENTDDHIFLIGDGGSGKTTSLIEILKKEYEIEKEEGRQIIVFFELSQIPQDTGKWYGEKSGGTFLEQFLASYCMADGSGRFASKDNHYVRELHEILFWDSGNERKQFTILFDGLNELGISDTRSKSLFYETMTRYLRDAKNVRCVLTGRNDAAEIAGEGLRKLRIAGLDDEKIEGILKEATDQKRLSKAEYELIAKNRQDSMTSEHRLWECLRIPFFLIMYCSMKEKSGVATRGEILKHFFHDKRETLEKKYAYSERAKIEENYSGKYYNSNEKIRMDLSIYLVLDFIVPEIAYTMFQRRMYFIDELSLNGLIWTSLSVDAKDTDNQRIYQEYKIFYDYNVDISEVIEAIKNAGNYDNIKAQICETLGIMRKTPEKTYFFTHQYFRDYFAARHVLNKLIEGKEYSSNLSEPWKDIRFLDRVSFLTGQEFSDYFSTLIGEVLCESHNVPVYDTVKGDWEEPQIMYQEQKVAISFLDLFRNVNIEKLGTVTEAYQTGLWNLFSILRHGRIQNSGVSDLSLLSFKGLNMAGIPLNGVLLSHFNRYGQESIHAEFVKCKNLFRALQTSEKSNDEMCYAVHPSKQRIIVGSKSRGFLREVDLETGEETRISLPEEDIIKVFYINDSGDLAFLCFSEDVEETGDEVTIKSRSPIRELLNRMKLNEAEDVPPGEFYYDESYFDNSMMEKLKEWSALQSKELLVFFADALLHRGMAVGTLAVYFYIHSEERLHNVNPLRIKDCSILDCGFSYSYHILYMFVQPLNKKEIVCYEYHTDRMPGYSLGDEKTYQDCTDKKALWFPEQSKENGFYASMVGESTYLIGSVHIPKMGIGLWSSNTNESRTAMQPFTPEEDFRIFSTASDGKGNVLMFIGYTIPDSHLHRYTPRSFNLPEKELLSSIDDFEIHVNELKSVVPTGTEGRFLVANYGGLSLYDCKAGTNLWNFPNLMESYQYRRGLLIVNAIDGIYLVNEETGRFVSITRKNTFIVRNLFGKVVFKSQFSSDSMILIYDGKQTVEWYSLRDARVKMISIVQMPDKELEMIAGDYTDMVIYGISDNVVFCWDALYGNLRWRVTIPRELDARQLYIDIDIAHNKLETLYEKKHYERYPLHYSYAWGTISLGSSKETSDEAAWITETKNPSRHIVSGMNIILEQADYSTGAKQGTFLSKQQYDENLKKEKTAENDLGKVFARYSLKDIYRYEREKRIFVETIPADEKVLGQWKNRIISVTEDGGKLRFRTKGTGGQTIEAFSWQEPLNGLFTVDEYVVLEQEDRNSFFYWNLEGRKKKQVFMHEVKRGILCTNKTVQDRLRPSKPCGKLKHIEDDSNLPVKTLGKHIKGLNYPAIAVAVILSLLGIYFTYGASQTGVALLDANVYTKEFVIKIMVSIYCFDFFLILQRYFVTNRLNPIRKYFPFCWLTFAVAIMFLCGITNVLTDDFLAMVPYNFFNSYLIAAMPFYVAGLRYRKMNGDIYSIYPLSELTQLLLMVMTGYAMLLYKGETTEGYILYVLVVFGVYISFVPKKKKISFVIAILIFLASLAGSIANRKETIQRFAEWRTGTYTQNLKEFVSASPFFGVSSAEVSIKPYATYCKDFALNYVIGNYGLGWGLMIVALFVIMSVCLLWGVKRCSDEGDRLVCLGCSIYLVGQMFFYIANNFGMIPYLSISVPFFALGSLGSTSSWMALAAYMAFHRAHKEVYLK